MNPNPHNSNLSQEAYDAQALSKALDRALAPEGPPADLAERIVAATSLRLAAQRARHQHERSRWGVLARIGPTWGTALAALVVAALGAGVWLSVNIAPANDDPLARAQRGLARMAQADTIGSTDQEIALVTTALDEQQYAVDWEAADRVETELLSDWAADEAVF